MIKELLDHFSSNKGYRMFDDVKPLLGLIRAARSGQSALEWPWKSTTVGILSNSDHRVPGILKSYGLRICGCEENPGEIEEGLLHSRPDVSFVTMSYDVGFEKPSPRFFQAADEAFASLPSSRGVSEADLVKVLVGDDLEKDIRGALDAGWEAVLVARRYSDQAQWKAKKDGDWMWTEMDQGRPFTVINNLHSLRLWDPILTKSQEETSR
jgi:beta-phosphoglucomutase-like phosphatase (HAD superfamily)